MALLEPWLEESNLAPPMEGFKFDRCPYCGLEVTNATIQSFAPVVGGVRVTLNPCQHQFRPADPLEEAEHHGEPWSIGVRKWYAGSTGPDTLQYTEVAKMLLVKLDGWDLKL